MERSKIFHNVGRTVGRLNDGVVEKAPRLLRPLGIGFGLGVLTVDQNWFVAVLSFTTAGGAELMLELKKRAERQGRNNPDH